MTNTVRISHLSQRISTFAARAVDDPSIQRRRDRYLTAAVFCLSLVVYARTLLPGVGYSGDVAKWQYLSETGGVPHATGYPLWLALIQAWGELMPWGAPAAKTNMLSAVFGAAAIAVLFGLMRTLNIRRTVAAATALTFALTPTFWTQASIAEVYTLHILFMGVVTLLLARWRLGASNAWLLAGLAIYALSFGHHMMTILALPGILWLLWSDRGRALTMRNAAWVVLFALLSACQYLYLLFMARTGGFNENPVHNLADLWSLIRGGQFQGVMWKFSFFEYLEDRVPLLGKMVGTEYLLLQAPIAYGVWRGLRADKPYRDISIHLLLLGFMSTMFATNYDAFDIEVFFLPLLFVLAVYLGWGIEGCLHWAGRNYRDHPRLHWAMAVALVAMPIIVGLGDYRRASQRGNTSDGDRIEQALSDVGHDALFITDSYDDYSYFAYFLLTNDLQERRLTVAGHPLDVMSARRLTTYLQGGDGKLAREVRYNLSASTMVTHHRDVWDAQVAREVREVPARGPLPVYTASRGVVYRLEEDGFEFTRLNRDLWRVDLPAASTPHSTPLDADSEEMR